MLFRGVRPRVAGAAPLPWLVGALSLVLCSGFHLLYYRGLSSGWHPAVTLAGMVCLELVVIGAFCVWARRRGWTPAHVIAAAAGAVLTYGWVSIRRMLAGATALGAPTTSLDVAGQVVLLLGILALAVVGARRAGRLT